MSVEMISALFFFVGLAPHPTQNFLERKFRDFKELQNKKMEAFHCIMNFNNAMQKFEREGGKASEAVDI